MELKPNSKVYIDTNLFIYYFENNPQYGNRVKNLFETLIEQNIKIISSELLYLELLVLPYKINNKSIIDLYTNIEKHIPNLQLIKLDKKILFKAAEIRANYSFKSPDAIHLATAQIDKCDYFFGSDKKLKSFKELKINVL